MLSQCFQMSSAAADVKTSMYGVKVNTSPKHKTVFILSSDLTPRTFRMICGFLIKVRERNWNPSIRDRATKCFHSFLKHLYIIIMLYIFIGFDKLGEGHVNNCALFEYQCKLFWIPHKKDRSCKKNQKTLDVPFYDRCMCNIK